MNWTGCLPEFLENNKHPHLFRLLIPLDLEVLAYEIHLSGQMRSRGGTGWWRLDRPVTSRV